METPAMNPLEAVITPEEQTKLDILKPKHGTIFILTIRADDGPKKLYLKKMDRLVYAMISKFIQTDELYAAELMLKNLCVEGPVDEVIADFDLLLTAARKLPMILPGYEVDLKKK